MQTVKCPDCGQDWGHSYCGTCKGVGTVTVAEKPKESKRQTVLVQAVEQTVIHTGKQLYYHCPGCKGHHSIPVLIDRKEDKSWNWNGDLIKPTISPSVKHFYPDSYYQQHPGLPPFCCHYHIREGRIEYCGDCTHDHNGKTVPLPAFSDAEVKMHAIESL